jgi:hypothetical protein
MGKNQEGNWSDMIALMAEKTIDCLGSSVQRITKSGSDTIQIILLPKAAASQ